jgi:hypothetical protein
MPMGKVLFFFVIFASFSLGLGLFFWQKDFGANLKRTEADGKGPNSNRWVTFRDAEDEESLGSCHPVFEIPEN